MTVRNLQNQTVTLVGRGANYPVDNGIVPSFVDADGKQYFLAINASGNTFCAIVDGQLRVDANAAAPISGIGYDRIICVNNPTERYNSTSALVFAQRCGIDVALGGLLLMDATDQSRILPLDDIPFFCHNGSFLAGECQTLVTSFLVEEGWGTSQRGVIGCNYEPVEDSSSPDFKVYASFLDSQWGDNVGLRYESHAAWVCVLAGVPVSVFALDS